MADDAVDPEEKAAELGDELRGMLEVVINYLNENYKKFMQKIWG